MRAKYGYRIGAGLLVLSMAIWIHAGVSGMGPKIWIDELLAVLGIAFIWYRDGYKRGHTEGIGETWANAKKRYEVED